MKIDGEGVRYNYKNICLIFQNGIYNSKPFISVFNKKGTFECFLTTGENQNPPFMLFVNCEDTR